MYGSSCSQSSPYYPIIHKSKFSVTPSWTATTSPTEVLVFICCPVFFFRVREIFSAREVFSRGSRRFYFPTETGDAAKCYYKKDLQLHPNRPSSRATAVNHSIDSGDFTSLSHPPMSAVDKRCTNGIADGQRGSILPLQG